ncbi:MAG: DUF998 domain-containing protein [Solimonas sp.]
MNDASTRRLLTAGVVAGPLVLAAGFAQAFLRQGFDLRRHASSQLALGEPGWIQSLNFVVAGLLMLLFALGARRALKGTPGGFWAPLLLGVFAVSHVAVGIFRTDPAFGFPPGPGTPAGLPSYTGASTHAALHSLFGGIGFNALMIACFVLARHFGRQRRGMMGFSLFTGFVIVATFLYAASWEARHTDPAVRAASHFNFLPMWLSLPVVWGYLTTLAWRLRLAAGSRP